MLPLSVLSVTFITRGRESNAGLLYKERFCNVSKKEGVRVVGVANTEKTSDEVAAVGSRLAPKVLTAVGR